MSHPANAITHQAQTPNPPLNEAAPALPLEILDHIFSFLPPKDVANVGLVSKDCQSLSFWQWQRICQERGFKRADENQTWYECARVQAGLYTSFVKGELLSRLPKQQSRDVTYNTDIASRDWNVTRISTLREIRAAVPEISWEPRKYTIEQKTCSDDDGIYFELTVYAGEESKKKEIVRKIRSEAFIVESKIHENLFATRDAEHNLKVWDLDNGSCSVTSCLPKKTMTSFNSFLLEFKGNILIYGILTSRMCYDMETEICIYHLDKSKKDYSFSIPGHVKAAALQGNILALHTLVEKSVSENHLWIIDINKKICCSYIDPMRRPYAESESNALLWGSEKLYIFKKADFYKKAIVEEWDFSKQGCAGEAEPPPNSLAKLRGLN